MKDELEDYKPGGELTAALLMRIISELLRLRKMDASPPLDLINMDGSSDEPPHLIINWDEGAVLAQVTTSDIAGGSLTAPTNGTVTLLYSNATPALATVTGQTRKVYNAYVGPLAKDSLCWVVYFQGFWWIQSPANSAVPMKLTSTLTARSGTTPGTGTANPETFNGTSLGTDTGTTYTILNSNATAVASGKIIWVTPWAGALWILTADCP